jgi:hypothetical protein
MRLLTLSIIIALALCLSSATAATAKAEGAAGAVSAPWKNCTQGSQREVEPPQNEGGPVARAPLRFVELLAG